MKIDILNTNGESLGRSVELPDDIFGIEPNEHVMYLAVKQYLNNQRQGTHKSKERSEVRGSGKKIKRQKGTGTARAGDIKNPIFRGGGRTFGPRPRKYNSKLNQKVRILARNSALSSKVKSGALSVVEDFSFDTPSTKSFAEVLNNLNKEGGKTILIVDDYDRNLYLSSRNYPKVKVEIIGNLNTYDILHAGKVIFSESAISGLLKDN